MLKRLVPRQIRILRIQLLAAVSIRKTPWLKPKRNDLAISIVTDPVPEGFYYVSEGLKSWWRRIRHWFVPLSDYKASAYRGHPASTRSVVEGLAKLNVACSYNPADLRDLSQTVVVMSGVSALRQMIKLKHQGYIRRLLVGPNIMEDPSSHKGILASPEVDRCLMRAPWCRLVARFLPSLEQRCVPWAAGVDVEYWRPGPDAARDRVLLYSKQLAGPTTAIKPYREELEARGYQVSTLEYGSYTPAQYRSFLQSSKFMVGFTRSETQGIAFAEAWACDVPTFIWNNSEPTYMGVAYGGSTAPYLTDNTGKFFSSLDEFRELLLRWEKGEFTFKARQWCAENMSDEVCARELLAIAQGF